MCSIRNAEGHRCLVRSHMDQTDIVLSGMDLIYFASLWILPLKFSSNQFLTHLSRGKMAAILQTIFFNLKRLILWGYIKEQNKAQ